MANAIRAAHLLAFGDLDAFIEHYKLRRSHQGYGSRAAHRRRRSRKR
jgi:hypothetical protein